MRPAVEPRAPHRARTLNVDLVVATREVEQVMNREIERLILESERLRRKSSILQIQAEAISDRLAGLLARCDRISRGKKQRARHSTGLIPLEFGGRGERI